MALPTIDLSLYSKGSDLERQRLASSLVKGLRRGGFVRIVNHGISHDTVCRTFEHVRPPDHKLAWSTPRNNDWRKKLMKMPQSQRFFQLPRGSKELVANDPGPHPQRGWSHVGAENSASLYQKEFLKSMDRTSRKDAREHFDQGSRNDWNHPNKWPAEDVIPGFRRHMETTFDEMQQACRIIMEALEIGLGLPKGTFLHRMTEENNASEFRLNHYPAIDVNTMRQGQVSRIWPHFDLGVITLLFQDEVGGLEVKDESEADAFRRVESRRDQKGDLIVNVSETLQRWTNNHLPAGLHRVCIPHDMQDENSEMVPERYSIAYFGKADRKALVGPLKEFLVDGVQPAYREMTAIQYHEQRLQSAY